MAIDITRLNRAGWTATASSAFSGTYAASKAIDGDDTTTWASGSASLPESLIIDMGSPQTFDGIAFQPRYFDFGGDHPVAFDVYVSTDGSTWGSSIYSATSIPATDAEKVYQFSSQTKQWIKITITNSERPSYAACAEFNVGTVFTLDADFAPHDLTTNSSHSPFVASSSSNFGGVFDAFAAFDGVWDGFNFLALHGSSGTLTLDLGAAHVASVTGYAIRVHSNSGGEAGRAPQDFKLQGSNNGSSFTDLDTRTGQTGWGPGQRRPFGLASPSSDYRYFRLNISNNNGDTDTQVGEFYLYGTTSLSTSFIPAWAARANQIIGANNV